MMYELFNIETEEVEAVRDMSSLQAWFLNCELRDLKEPRRWTNPADEAMPMAA